MIKSHVKTKTVIISCGTNINVIMFWLTCSVLGSRGDCKYMNYEYVV